MQTDVTLIIQTLYSVFSWSSDYSSLESSWVWCDKLCPPGFGDGGKTFSSNVRLGSSQGSGWATQGHSFTELSLRYSCVVLAVWLGSLTCWKVTLQPRLRSWVLWTRFSLRIYLCTSLCSASPQPSSAAQSLPLPLPPHTHPHPHGIMGHGVDW